MVIEPRMREDELECGCPPGRCSAKNGWSLIVAAGAVVVAGLVVLVACLMAGGVPWSG